MLIPKTNFCISEQILKHEKMKKRINVAEKINQFDVPAVFTEVLSEQQQQYKLLLYEASCNLRYSR